MTIYEIKRRTQETSPYYFSRDTMKFFGQTLKSFRVVKQVDGRYWVCAKRKNGGYSIRYFNPENNELERFDAPWTPKNKAMGMGVSNEQV